MPDGRATRLGRPPGRRARGVRSGLLRAPRRGGAAAAHGGVRRDRLLRRDGDEPDVLDRGVDTREHLAHRRGHRARRAVVRLRPERSRGGSDRDRTVGRRVGGGDEALPRPLAAVPIHVDERARRTGGRGLRLQDQLAYEQLAVVVRGAVRTGSRRALAVAPGGRQLGRGEAVVDAGRVGAAVPDRAHDLALVVVAGLGRGAGERRRVVVQVRAAEALGVRVAVIAAVRTRIARIGVLGHLVVARLRVRRVHHTDAAADLVDARAEAAEDVHEEGRDEEARLVAAALRAARDAAVRVVGDLAARDARAGRVRVPARDARGVLAFREGVRPVHGDRRLHAGREGHDLAVRGDPRELHARTAGSAAVGVAAARPEAVRRGVRRAAHLPARALELVRTGDRLPDDDRRALRHFAGGGQRAHQGRRRRPAHGGRRGARGGAGLAGRARIADEREGVLVDLPRLRARAGHDDDLALARLRSPLLPLREHAGHRAAARRLPGRREAERRRSVALAFHLDALERRTGTGALRTVGA